MAYQSGGWPIVIDHPPSYLISTDRRNFVSRDRPQGQPELPHSSTGSVSHRCTSRVMQGSVCPLTGASRSNPKLLKANSEGLLAIGRSMHQTELFELSGGLSWEVVRCIGEGVVVRGFRKAARYAIAMSATPTCCDAQRHIVLTEECLVSAALSLPGMGCIPIRIRRPRWPMRSSHPWGRKHRRLRGCRHRRQDQLIRHREVRRRSRD